MNLCKKFQKSVVRKQTKPKKTLTVEVITKNRKRIFYNVKTIELIINL